MAKGADTPRLCITDRTNRADLQVWKTQINVPDLAIFGTHYGWYVPKNMEMGTYKYIRYETIDISN